MYVITGILKEVTVRNPSTLCLGYEIASQQYSAPGKALLHRNFGLVILYLEFPLFRTCREILIQQYCYSGNRSNPKTFWVYVIQQESKHALDYSYGLVGIQTYPLYSPLMPNNESKYGL